jgi:asparagine synthase (glutamine-hydrolysing)
MISNDMMIKVLYNGEIYNHNDLRTECPNYVFKTKSDTEVIIALYQNYGISFVNKLIGIFSIVIIDDIEKKTYLIRDRYGVKPLYYATGEKYFLFSSELRPIMLFDGFTKQINPEAVEIMLALKYTPSELTVLKDVFKVRPGTIIEFNDFNDIKEIVYWDNIKIYRKVKKVEFSKNSLKRELKSAITRNLVSDVEIVAYLSGGVDSSTVTALSKEQNQNISSYTMGFDETEYDESSRAKEIAKILGVNNITRKLNEDDLAEVAVNISSYCDDPLGDSSFLPTYLISKLVRESGKKVVLSGDGGDEFFYGYNNYDYSKRYHTYYNLISPFSKLMKPIASIFSKSFIGYGISLSSSLEGFYYGRYSGFSGLLAHRVSNKTSKLDDLTKYFSFLDDIKDLDPLEINTLFDQRIYMIDDVLQKVDRASMACSIESRVPLLDHPLTIDSYRYHYKDHYKENEKKHLLKEILREYLPEEIVSGRKKGFAVPLEKILKNNRIKTLIYSYSSKDYIDNQGLFSHKEISIVIDNFYIKNKSKSKDFIWNFYVFQSWYNKYIHLED